MATDEHSSCSDIGRKDFKDMYKLDQVIAWRWRLLHALPMLKDVYCRKLARAATICDTDSLKAKKSSDVAKPSKLGEESYMSGVELVWTERGQRLHMSRECVSLQRSSNLRSKTSCKLCARDHP